MPFNSSIYTDLQLPTLNSDNSTYGTIINTYFQALETKLKNLSDRINAAGVGDSSTLAQINSDIDGILPDPYSGNYSTVSTWPAYNTELTALGLSPPQTASEINTFFDGGDFATFASFLNGKLDSIDTILATAESDIADAEVNICKANIYSSAVTSPSAISYLTVSTHTLNLDTSGGTFSPFSSDTIYPIISGSDYSSLGYTVSDVYTQFYIPTAVAPVLEGAGQFFVRTSGSLRLNSQVATWGKWTSVTSTDSTDFNQDGTIYNGAYTGSFWSGNAYLSYKLVKIIPVTPDVSGCG